MKIAQIDLRQYANPLALHHLSEVFLRFNRFNWGKIYFVPWKLKSNAK